MPKTGPTRRHALSTALLLFACIGAAREDLLIPGAQAHAVGIRLGIHVAKREFNPGEPIVVTALLENVSEGPIYIGRGIVGLLTTRTDHELVLGVIDGRGREVPVIAWDAATGLPTDREERARAIQDAYLLLHPRTLYGVRATVPVRLAPGVYRLVVTYNEYLAGWLSPEERGLLHFPVQTESLSSAVRIRVRKPGAVPQGRLTSD